MITSLPFAFTVRYRQQGKASLSTTHNVGYVNAKVPELAWYEVRTVAEWTKYGIGDQVGVRHKCISYNGGLYVSVRNERGDTLSRLPAYAGDWISDPAFGFDIMGREMLSGGEEDAMRTALLNDARRVPRFGIAGIVETNEKRNRAIAQHCVNSLIYAGGDVWKKVPWIALQLGPYLDDFHVEVAVGKTGFDDRGTDLSAKLFEAPGNARRFGLREIERVRAHTQGNQLWFRFRNLIAQPDAPEIDSEEDFLLRCAKYAVNKAADDVGELPTGAVNDWLAMRDAYESYIRDSANGLPDDIGGTLRRFVPHIQDDRARQYMEEAMVVLDVYDAERNPDAMQLPSGPKP
ncbi:hypothetical protein O9X98_06790 [Agrobacterium salinitolerans]|nr:hypothetical protein [Agrobacterium salinitolerans]